MDNKKLTIILLILTGLFFGSNYVFAVRPAGTPPADNVDLFIDTKSTAQTKLGGLVVGDSTSISLSLLAQKLGVGVTSSSYAVETTGKLALTDGTQGDLKVLTSRDSFGTAYWKSYSTGGASSVDMPSGSIVAFDLGSCPSGWSGGGVAGMGGYSAGRVIVGTGLADGGTDPQGATSALIYSSNKTYNERGGAETHTLTYEETVHRHEFDSDDGDREKNLDDGSGVDYYKMNDPIWGPTSTAGGDPALGGQSRPHTEMQPYIVLTYCVKD